MAASTGYVGTLEPLVFQIWRPSISSEWTLTARLPGCGDKAVYGGGPDELKAEAERWLEEFVASLGASFGPDLIVRWQDVRTGDLVLLDDCLITAERVEVYQSPWGDGTTFPAAHIGHRLDNGVLVDNERHGDRYTAVRREANR
jgi:hypothetical protein